jgi:TetR/AcrR family transcriptional regulator of autoinduction and epiphytic fitness
MSVVKRRYLAPRRQQRAAETRRLLAASARRLFLERGYVATTIEAIAADAGLAVQTFYAVFGSKKAVLLSLLDEGEEAAEFSELMNRLHALSDAREQLRLIVHFNVRLFGQLADLFQIRRTAGAAEPDIAAVERAGSERRRVGQSAFVREWAGHGELRPGLSESEAADTLWALTSPDAYRLFVVERRWNEARYRTWLFSTLEWLLFGPRPPDS